MTASVKSSHRPPVTFWNHLRAVILLPFMNTIVMPSILLLVFRDAAIGKASVAVELTALIVAIVLAASGLTLVVRSIALFVRRGQGTLAPWDPTRVLIVEDVYRYSRNPMKAGLFLLLLAESLLLRSPALLVWSVCFIVANVVYIRVHEDRGLRARFGDAYDSYCRLVPRWLPLLPAQTRGLAPQPDASPSERWL
jgi:protein-S-isoprenylcysteine O-methyltransferase Ste14